MTVAYRTVLKTRMGADGVTEYVEQSSYVWERDRLPNGQVNMRDHWHTRERQFLLNRSGSEAMIGWIATSCPVNGFSMCTPALEDLEAETYARLRGKLYKGSASLGVTFASWKQSREMIVNRYRQMSFQSDQFEKRANAIFRQIRTDRNTRRTEIRLSKLGSAYLEMVFGWQPLLTDIHAACKTVIDTRPKTERVTAQAKTYVSQSDQSLSGTAWRTTLSGVASVKRSAMVEISNPNLRLADRAGLLNPAAIAWDLVPWSFVVNMFSNAGQLVNSITDFAGLEFPSSSITRKTDTTYRTTYWVPSYPPAGSSQGDYRQDFKYTVLGGVSRPPLIFRLPEVNWGLACIAASLFFQKFSRLDSLMSYVQHK